MNCSCTATNRSSRAKPWRTSACSGATVIGLVFWISIALTGGPPCSASASPVRMRPILDWSSQRVVRIDRVVALDDRFVELPDRVIVEEGAAALILPGAGHRRNAQRRMHLRRAVAAAGKTIAEPEERYAWSGRPARANASISATGTPQIADAHSGVRVFRCASSSTGAIGVARPYRRDRHSPRGTAHA